MPQNQMLFFPSFRVDFYPAGRMFASAGLQLGQGYPGTLFRVGNGFVRGKLVPLQTATAAPLPSPGRDGHRSGRPWPIKPEHDKRMTPKRTVMEGGDRWLVAALFLRLPTSLVRILVLPSLHSPFQSAIRANSGSFASRNTSEYCLGNALLPGT